MPPSPLPSSSQSSDLPSSTQASFVNDDTAPNAAPLHSYKDSSGSEIYNETLQLESQGIYYAANENLSSQCEFLFNKDIKGEILVSKDTNKKISEFILTGIFEIDAKNFIMTSDGKWNSNNPIGLHQVKPSCHLLPVRQDHEFSYSINDFPAIIRLQ
jgi:hypothetical protein